MAELKSDPRDLVNEVAGLMTEFHLSEAVIERDGMMVSFRRDPLPRVASQLTESFGEEEPEVPSVAEIEPAKGTPVTSPMAGIVYNAASPGATPFVREGDTVTVGQTVALIEAMKVYSEVPCPMSGTVLKIVVQTGAVVQPGDVLMVIG